jgi:hypothetical protein
MMKSSALLVALTCVPVVLAAQQASASASATAKAKVDIPASYSAESHAKIEAAFQAARAKNVPEQPMQRRMAEGQAKGASEAQVIAAVQKTETRLEASQSAMIRAGRAKPHPDEIAGAEQAMERGTTDAQIEALVKHAPADRSLAVAFSVLTRLEARGEPVDRALATVAAKLDAQATDEALVSLASGSDASATGSAAAAANAHGKNPSATAGVNGTANAAVGAAAGLTSSVSGAVTGKPVTKKP